jgi:hypothetical protein
MQQPSFPLSVARSLAAVLGTLTSLLLAPDVSWGQQPQAAENGPARVFPDVDRFGDPLPTGALARLGTERFRHRYPGYGTYSPDGKRAAPWGKRITTLQETSNWKGSFDEPILLSWCPFT